MANFEGVNTGIQALTNLVNKGTNYLTKLASKHAQTVITLIIFIAIFIYAIKYFYKKDVIKYERY